MVEDTNTRIESELEVKSYIQNLKYALQNGASIEFQAKRLVDEKRKEEYTNQYTVNKLFPDENPIEALKREVLESDPYYRQKYETQDLQNNPEMQQKLGVYDRRDIQREQNVFSFMKSLARS